MLRPGGELWGAALLQHLQPQGDKDNHSQQPLCPASAPALPPGLQPEFRLSARFRCGKAELLHHQSGKAGAHLRRLRGGDRLHPLPPHQLRHDRGGLLPLLLHPGGLPGRRQRHRPGKTLPSGAGHPPPQRQPGGLLPAAGHGLCPQGDPAGRQLPSVLQAGRRHRRFFHHHRRLTHRHGRHDRQGGKGDAQHHNPADKLRQRQHRQDRGRRPGPDGRHPAHRPGLRPGRPAGAPAPGRPAAHRQPRGQTFEAKE